MKRHRQSPASFLPVLSILLLCSCASSPTASAPLVSTGGNSSGSAAGSGGGSGLGGGAASGTSPSNAAYVYVSSAASGGNGNQVEAFSAASDGTLTPVSGSPFQANLTSMAVNGSYLFGVGSDGSLDAYSIGSSGALTLKAATPVSTAGNCYSLGKLFFDHTGATLYALNDRGAQCSNNTYESFAVDASTGEVTDLGNSGANNWLAEPASFLANNAFAYTASCLNDMYWGIWSFQRGSNGLLASVNITAAPPTPPSGSFYCPSLAAADTSDHVAIAMQPVDRQTFSGSQPAQLATYTAAGNGNLTTTSTAANMPTAQVGSIMDLKMSPSGALLAVSGTQGLQVFHFNGANPITAYTGPLTSDEIDRVFWDNQNHLYAISRPAGKLYVFTVTGSAYAQAPGSPYPVASPQDLAVQPD